MTDVLLATFALMPDGEPGGDALLAALEEEGVSARWVRWDDPEVDWAGAPLVAARSTWDYQRRLPAFLDWARHVETVATLLNGAEVFAWNADKAYLRELAAAGLPVVPTTTLDDADLVEGLGGALAAYGSVVVKPRTGAGGVGVVVCDSVGDPRLEGLTQAPWVVQPLVPSVRTEGELSVYVVDGEVTAQVDKLPASGSGEVRVHELYGGRSRPGVATPESVALATSAVRVAADLRGADLAYARVDLMRWQGELVVSELELIEPGLYLDVLPGIATPFAVMVRRRLGR